MSVPQWFWFVDPVLRYLGAAEQPLLRRDVVANAPKSMDLSPDDWAEVAGKGRLTKVEDRAGWALAYSGMAGLVKSPKRAQWEITDAGRALLSKYPHGIPEETLVAIRRSARVDSDADAGDVVDVVPPPDPSSTASTPDERLRSAYNELRQSIAHELLDLVRSSTPEFFEHLVIDLLHAMGYGKTRDALEHVGGPGDGGFDGVIALDRLGLEKVYVQAKRHAEDNPISRPMIQAFLGALAGRRASKGVFITTSRFSKEARDFARSASDGLVLLDGAELAELMIDYGIGVSRRETLTLVDIDGDYFEGA